MSKAVFALILIMGTAVGCFLGGLSVGLWLSVKLLFEVGE